MRRMDGAVLNGAIGRQIRITLVERVQPFELLDLRNWRAGKKWTLIPEEEQYRKQMYERQPNAHFGELFAMRGLREEGFPSWLYDNYKLFRDPPAEEAELFTAGTERAREALGGELYQKLRDAAAMYAPSGLAPGEPDLMAWREEDGRRRFRFLAVRLEFKERGKSVYRDRVDAGALLGLALVAAVVPGCEVQLVRYMDRDLFDRFRKEARPPTTHQKTFEPRRSIATASGVEDGAEEGAGTAGGESGGGEGAPGGGGPGTAAPLPTA
jgi:hypothetical protein